MGGLFLGWGVLIMISTVLFSTLKDDLFMYFQLKVKSLIKKKFILAISRGHFNFLPLRLPS